MAGATDMPDYGTEEEPPREEPGTTISPNASGEQDPDNPRRHDGKTPPAKAE